MPLDTKSSGFNTGCDSPAVWELPEALQQLAECGDAELVDELIVIFQSDTTERLQLLGRAVAAGNLDVVRVEAHTIKGSALQVGAGRVAETCRQMELEIRKTPPLELFSLFSRLQLCFEEACRVMTAQPPR